jgi:hypothetical protein
MIVLWDGIIVREFKQEKLKNTMRKLMTLMLGLSLALGAVSVSFADDAPAPTKKKGKKKKTDTGAPKAPKVN